MRSSVAVALGAVVGATTRWWIGEALATDRFPWATLLVNLAGCAVIGGLAVKLERGTDAWYFAVTGVLGGLTTASTFAVDTQRLLDDGRPAVAAAYVVASIVGGLIAVSTTRTWAMRMADR